MSSINGDKSRVHRERKHKIAKRARIREFLKLAPNQPKTGNSATGKTPKAVGE